MSDPARDREEILQAIRRSLRGQTERSSQVELEESLRSIATNYIRTGQLDKANRLALFQTRVKEYDATIFEVAANEISHAIGERLTSRSKARVVVPRGLPREWLPQGFDFRIGNDLPLPELDEVEGVITSCDVAIAITGTIVLQHGPGQGPRRLTLVPDYHLCILFADQVVETVPEAFDRMAERKTRTTTLISGPSATSDIEMTRVKGVHGPRTLDILLVQ